MNPIHLSFQNILKDDHFPDHNSHNNWWILPLIELYLYFMIIYLCIKYESNTLLFSKDIKRKPFFKVEKGP